MDDDDRRPPESVGAPHTPSPDVDPAPPNGGTTEASPDPKAAPDPAPPPDSPLAAHPAPEPEPALTVPGAIEVVSQGIDLNLAGSGPIRRATLYAGAMYLLLLGPVAFIVALVLARYGPEIFDAFVIGDIQPRRFDFGPAPGAFFVGGLAVAAVSIDLQNMAVGLIDSQASGRGLALRPALAIARRSFWRLVFASIASGVLVLIVTAIVQAVLGFDRPAGAELDLARNTIVQLVVGMPFAYIGAAVVIGGAGPLAAIGSSVRLARRRWRLAFVIGLVNTATGLLAAAFALGAGGDILGRFATLLGVGGETAAGPLQIAGLAVLIAVAIAAIGSLTMTVAALSVAPQVIAYRRLGGPRAGGQALDAPASPPGESVPPEIANRSTPLITIGMWIAIAFLALFTLASVFRFA